MAKLIDVFPFFNELDVLELRLNELAPVVDKFVIVESRETYGGDRKPLYLADNWERFKPFHDKIVHGVLDKVYPPQDYRLDVNVPGVNASVVRTLGRAREANQREQMVPFIQKLELAPDDLISFGDCDEIPRASAIQEYRDQIVAKGVHRLKQRTFYYNINCLIDYGRDVCSRARVGRYRDLLLNCRSSLYAFRMYGNKKVPEEVPAIENGGWHFSYFGGSLEKLHEKVSALNPFLAEYKLFGDGALVDDIVGRRDLHRRPLAFSELPGVFEKTSSTDPTLPAYLLDNPARFEHFTAEYFARKYRG